MGFFEKIFGKKEDTEEVAVDTATESVEEADTFTIDMSKEHLNNVLIDMSKGSKIDMTKHTARVALVMDYSGSMDELFDNGSVQKTVSRLLPIALRFDDNGELESWLFSDDCEQLKSVTEKNYLNYVKKVMKKSGMYMGGTEYAPVLNEVVTYYKDVYPSDVPAFVIFITDGDNGDPYETDKIIRELSKYNIFVQFIGIGRRRFNYLKKLDDLDGRDADNTGFTAVEDMDKMTDEELYTEILRQYKDWLNNK